MIDKDAYKKAKKLPQDAEIDKEAYKKLPRLPPDAVLEDRCTPEQKENLRKMVEDFFGY